MEADSVHPKPSPREWGDPQGGRIRRFAPLGCVLFGTFLPHSRKVHFSTVGGLHGVRLPRQKNSLYKKAASAERISGNRNLKIQLTTRMGICNTPHHAVGTAKILSLTVSRHPLAVCGAPRRRLCRRRSPSCRGKRQRSRRGRMPGSSRQSRLRGHGMRP